MVSIVNINNAFCLKSNSFNISQQTKWLDIAKAVEESDLSAKLVRRYDGIIVDYLH